MTVTRQSAIREGLIAGLLGATSVAVWFFTIDLLRGDPLLVPAALGHGFLHAVGITGVEGRMALVLAYYDRSLRGIHRRGHRCGCRITSRRGPALATGGSDVAADRV